MRKIILRSNTGQSLIQVLVTMGIVSIVFLVMTGMISNLFNSVHSISVSGNAESLREGVQLMLTSPKLCQQNFSGTTLSSGWTKKDIPTLNFSNTVLAKKNTSADGLLAKSIQLVYNAGPFAEKFQNPDGTVSDVNRWYATLEIGLQRDAAAGQTHVGGNALKSQSFYISLLTDGSGAVTACNGGIDNAFVQDTCVSGFGGQWDASQLPHCLLPLLGIGSRLNSSSVNYDEGFGITQLDNPIGQSRMILRGVSDGGLTYSALYLSSLGAGSMTSDSWVMSFIKGTGAASPGPPNSFLLGRWKAGGPLSPALTVTDGPPHKIGINNSSPTAVLDVVGNGKFNGTLTLSGAATGPAFVTPSDIRLKENIKPIGSARAEGFKDLQAYSYTMIDDPEQRLHLGFIAQDLAKKFPEAVETSADGHLAVNYPMLIAPLAQFVQSTRATVDALAKENAAMKRRLEKLEARKCSH